MTDLDRAIRQTLSAEDAELFDRLGANEALHRQVLSTFESRFRWFNAGGWIAGFLLFALTCLSAWRFMHASDLAEMLRWGAAAALALTGVVLIKVWFWMELQTNAILREVKRLQVQIASLTVQVRRS